MDDDWTRWVDGWTDTKMDGGWIDGDREDERNQCYRNTE